MPDRANTNPDGASDTPPVDGAEPADDLARWALELAAARTWEAKLTPPEPPAPGPARPEHPGVRLAEPGRPPGLLVIERAPRAPRPEAVRQPEGRLRLLHTFWHHELQAAELFAWAIAAFPQTPPEFRRGLARLALEELAHAAGYARLMARDGHRPGELPVRDWFWQRIPAARRPEEFLARLGLGFEGANLEHAERYAKAFRACGDDEAADFLGQLAVEEERHVRFALHWFGRFAGGVDFERWRACLEPLSPSVMRGAELAREARERAGFDDTFLDALEAWGG
jgi:uncharacterized ferritin-like protein (DUF455 family)